MYIPFFLFALVPFVVGLAILQSGHDLPQQIVFGVMAILVILIQLAGAIWVFWARWKGRFSIRTIIQLIDSYTGLVLAWGMGCVAFWVIDNSRYFGSSISTIEDSHWLVAVQFTCLAIEHTTTVGHDIMPKQILTEMYLAFISAFHLFYTLAILATGIDALLQSRDKPEVEDLQALKPNPRPPRQPFSSFQHPVVAYAMQPIGDEYEGED